MGPCTRRMHALAAAALAVAACATGSRASHAGPPAFEGVRSVALVRWSAGRAEARPRDPLDALAESLLERRIAARILEVGHGASEPSVELERLHAWAEARAGAPTREWPARLAPLGGEAGRIVGELGVDAIVLLHRFDRFDAPGLLSPIDPLRPFGPFPRHGASVRGPPLGALTLVDREGRALVLDWGPGWELDPSALANAAEAVDAALRVLAGEPIGE